MALITSDTVVVCVSAPLVPVIVNVEVPVGVVPEVVMFSVDDPDPVIEAGVNEPVAPVGSPLTLSATVPVKPVPAVTVAVYEVPLPWGTGCEAGEAVKEKFGDTVMVRVGGFGSLNPLLSVTVNEATSVPTVEKVTAPGFCTLLVAGVPPGNTQEYPVMDPLGLGSVPVPANVTDCPAPIVTLVAGLAIEPVGGCSEPVTGSCTKLATEGTPEEFTRNSM